MGAQVESVGLGISGEMWRGLGLSGATWLYATAATKREPHLYSTQPAVFSTEIRPPRALLVGICRWTETGCQKSLVVISRLGLDADKCRTA